MNSELENIWNIEKSDNEHIVAFLDILGFKSHVENYLDPENAYEGKILNIIKIAIKLTEKTTYMDLFKQIEDLEKLDFKIQYKQFSDCTCLSIPNINDNPEIEAMMICIFIYLLRDFHSIMLRFDLYLRGGLSVGFHYEDDNMIFSKGLIKAYELESKKAVYPRIIIDDELIKRLEEFWGNHKDILYPLGVDKLLVSDWDGSIFINPFNLSQESEETPLEMENSVFQKALLELERENLSFNGEIDDLRSRFLEIDYDAQIRVSKNLEYKIEKLSSDKIDDNILRKYIWLNELFKWNLDPESSRIRFEYLLK